MSEYLEKIDRLTSQEIANIIRQEDLEFLHKAIQEDPEAHAVWQQKHDQHADETVRRLKAAYTPSAVYDNVMGAIRVDNNRKRFSIRIAAGIAATAILVVGATLFYTTYFHSSTTSVAYTPKHRIELQMPDGEKIDLSTTTGQLPAGGVTLNNTNKTLRYSTPKEDKPLKNLATLSVPAGKDYKVELSDGTEIWLNAATVLQFPFNFSGPTREITVHGEAYIKVAPNASKPFLVHLPNSTVQVLGTEFNINTYHRGIERVALVKGAVKVKQGNTQTGQVLKPGQEAVGTSTGIRTQSFYADEVLSWREGIYYFNSTPLADICPVFSRWFGVEVVLDDPASGQKRLSGRIDRNQPLSKSLELFKKFGDTEYYFSKDSVLHIR